jgi:hypothetical protein
MKTWSIGHVFVDRFRKGVRFLKNHPDTCSQVGDIHFGTIDIHAVKQHGPFYSSAFNQVVEPIEASQQGGFTTTGWPNERCDLIFEDVDIDFEESLAVPVKKVDLIQGKFDGVSLGIVVRRLAMTVLHVEPL